MRALVRVALVATVAALGTAAPAQAHTLLPKEAASAAYFAAHDWADARFTRMPDIELSRRDCRRVTRHERICTVTIEPRHQLCLLDVRVRLAGYTTRERILRYYPYERVLGPCR
jgi:hypothetical protein